MTALATQPEHSGDDRIVEWRRHLLGLLDWDWRPGEFDPDPLVFIPASRRTNLKCVRDGCDEIAVQKSLCTICRREKWLSGLDLEEFRRTPVNGDRSNISLTTCLVGCRRTTLPSGLCRTHNDLYRRYGDGEQTHASVLRWIEQIKPVVLSPGKPCVVPGCWRDRRHRSGLCHGHRSTSAGWIEQWNRAGRQPRADVDLWLARKAEPVHEPSGVAFAKLGAVPFGLLEGPSALS